LVNVVTADFRRAGIDCRFTIVTVLIVGNKACRCCAPLGSLGRIAEGVIINIAVEGQQRTFVNLRITVVINAVAEFVCIREDRRVLIVAISFFPSSRSMNEQSPRRVLP